MCVCVYTCVCVCMCVALETGVVHFSTTVNVVGTKMKSWGCCILLASKVIFYLLIDFIAGS